jgi:hypothetical protein
MPPAHSKHSLPGEGRRSAFGVDDAQLPVLAFVVRGDQGLDRLCG